MQIAIIIACVAALLALTNATAPIPTNMYSQFKDIYIEGMSIRAYIMTVEFDQPIYINGIPITASNLTTSTQQQGSCGNNNGPKFPPLTFLMDGQVTVTCGNMNWKVDLKHEDNNDPPRSILTTVSTYDTGSSFMGFLSGFAMPEYVNPNAISFIKLISQTQGGSVQYLSTNTTEDSIRTCGNKTVRIGSGTISSATGQYISTTPISTPAKITIPSCDYNTISSFKHAFDYVSNIAKSLAVDATLYKQFSFLQGALDSRDALSACRSLASPMFTTQTVMKTLRPTQQCVYQQGTLEYNNSACCNNNLQYSQCCAPMTPITNVTVIKNITLDRIVSQCSHPNNVILSLYSYINIVNLAVVQAEDQDSLSQRFQKFQSKCNSLIYGKKCAIDADCKYSQSCDTNQGTCKIPWGSDANLVLSCYYDQFDPTLRSSLAGLWSLQESDKAGFLSVMSSKILMDDCIGSNSWNLQTSCQPDNNGCETCTYSNKTKCLAPKSCNWNWQITNQADCLTTTAVDTSQQFCGQCWGDGNSCWSQSIPAYCVRDTYDNQISCQAANYTWYTPPWQNGICVDPKRKSLSACLPTQACPTLSPDGENCRWWDNHVCYAPNVTLSECNAANSFTKQYSDGMTYHLEWQQWRNNGNGVCAFNRQWSSNMVPFTTQFCASFSSAVNNKTVKFFPGGRWSSGQYDTQQKCQTGNCNWQDPNERQSGWDLTPQQCSQKQMCNQPCPRCRASKSIGAGIFNYCYSSGNNVTSMDDCSRKTGQWSDSVVGSNGRCFFTQATAINSSQSCVAYGRSVGVLTKWATCETLSINTCSNTNATDVGELGSWLQCYWDMNAPCRTPAECVNSGRCNDDDKEIWQQNGRSIPGSCQVNNVLDNNGWPGDCSALKSKSTNQSLSYSRYPMKCVDQSVLTATDCTAIGGLWKTKAKSQADCLADMACYDEGSNWPNGKSATQCSLCSGTMAPIYSWTAGQWINASMNPLQWKNKSYSSVNQWGKRIDYNNLWQTILSPAVYYYLGSSVYSSLTTKYSLLADLFTQISCDCTEGRDQRNCFGQVRVSPLASALLQKGKLNKVETSLGVIKVVLSSNISNALPARRLLANGQVTITVGQVTAASLATVANNVPDYRVVKASPYVNTIVGELVGDGSQIAGLTTSMSQISVTLYLSQSIAPDAKTYPIPWIGYLKANTTKVFPLQGISVVATNSSITTTNITSDGTYFPVYLTSNWKAMLATTKQPTMNVQKATTKAMKLTTKKKTATMNKKKATTAAAKKATTQASARGSANILQNGSPSPSPSVSSSTTSPSPSSTSVTGSPTTSKPAASVAIQQYPALAVIVFTSLCAFVLF